MQKIHSDVNVSMTHSPAGPSSFTPPPDAHVRPRSRLRTSLLIGFCCLMVYNVNRRAISAGDTYPARYLPFAILQHHSILMNSIEEVAAQGRGDTAFWILPRFDGSLISLYPVTLPLLITPLYIPAVAWLQMRGGGTIEQVDRVARVMEKLSASFLAALSVSLLYLLLRRRTTARTALLLTIAYAFGTTTWVISSQALWQHGMAEVLVIVGLLLITGPCTTARTLAAGLVCGLIACNRPPDIILAGAIGTYALFWAGGLRRAFLLVMATALPMFVVLLYNLRFAGNIAGGYGVIGHATFFSHSLLPGIGGLLFSPAHGLFVFSPFLIVMLLAFRQLPQGREERRLTLFMIAAVLIQLFLYAKTDWRGGLSWGPRYMTDLLPFLLWILVPVVAALRGAGRVCFLLAVGVAIGIEAIGAFFYSGWIDMPIYAVSSGPHQMDAAWRWRNAPFVTSISEGLAAPELGIRMQGTFDAVAVEGRLTDVITAGDDSVATGWALAASKTPWQVAVSIDGRDGSATNTFTDRPDVRAALHEAAPSGWRIPLQTSRLPLGDHHLAFLVWGSPNGEGHYLGERILTVRSALAARNGAAKSSDERTPRSMEAMADVAATRIREHQQAAGYWLTSYTSGTRFDWPHPEMNTFLTALMIDVLDPLPPQAGVETSLQRARRHLTSQIEPGGLVRYHGLPDGPGIGKLGCVITPDTDNTALVWRIAPGGDRRQLTAALSTITRYRRADGLYRTWLARPEDYECLDPGNDPNPADVAIQMHLLMLLSEVRPAAGRALCEALRPVVDDDRIWVYYRKAPLVPILRLNDLHRDGCDLELPGRRTRTEVPGQNIWLDVAGWLDDSVKTEGSPPDAERIRAVLQKIGSDEFALVRTNPPLLYHNDLTATVSRYYWSEDVGYALWLRLYDNYELHGH
ncbi:MAG: hypothetical protein ABI718_03295 [Acidobacteriota bacterium]